MKKKFTYDLFVIGGGSGGISCARNASKFTQKVALANFVNPTPHGIKWGLGGTCVNVGCIPKKLMHQTSILGEQLKEAKEAGWEVTTGQMNYQANLRKINMHIKQLNFGYLSDMIKNKIKYYNAFVKFIDNETLLLK